MTPRTQDNSLITGADDQRRCWWCGDDPVYVQYHDHEWGKPVQDDRLLFEKMCLEGFQAGLSWITILKKRPAFRQAFCEFDFHQVARFGDPEIETLVQNADIIRHRGKIKTEFFWQFKPAKHVRPKSKQGVAAITTESTAMSKALKKHGWTFVGPTTCYALMQATGMVNDHLVGCDF
jgi:DNA-3-methyladenine glycosylase I